MSPKALRGPEVSGYRTELGGGPVGSVPYLAPGRWPKASSISPPTEEQIYPKTYAETVDPEGTASMIIPAGPAGTT
jgi:hypothetical protein